MVSVLHWNAKKRKTRISREEMADSLNQIKLPKYNSPQILDNKYH